MSRSHDSYRWGVIGPGRFARMFCEELRGIPRAELGAVASRDLQRSQSFAHEFGFARAYGSYVELFADPEIDIVYVVVPHAFHRAIAEHALRAGKAVVCEKPLTPSAADTRALVEVARTENVFLMEALKTGFLPAFQQAKRWAGEGAIGEIKIVKAEFCFMGSTDPEDRLLNPALAGGSVLDVGIYPLSIAYFLLGGFRDIRATGIVASTGVDEAAAISTRHHSGAIASLTCSIQASHGIDASIIGTKGKIHLPKSHRATEAILVPNEGDPTTYHAPDDSRVKGEILAAMAALDEGLIECPSHTHADSIALAEAMDEVMRQVLRSDSEGIK